MWDRCDGAESLKGSHAVGPAHWAGQQMQLSARAFHRILKLARTIVADPASFAWADLAECDQIETPHLAEAIQYRPRRMV